MPDCRDRFAGGDAADNIIQSVDYCYYWNLSGHLQEHLSDTQYLSAHKPLNIKHTVIYADVLGGTYN